MITWKIPTDLLEQIDLVAPPGTRSAWIEQACRHHLTRKIEAQNQLIHIAAKVERMRIQDTRENGPGVGVPCTHPKWYADSTGKNRCVDCKAPKH